MADTGSTADGGELGLRARKKQRTHRQILVSARRLFTEQDIASVSMDDIAAAADVARGTVFNYFQSKSEIVATLAAQNVEDFTLLVLQMNARPGTMLERLDSIFTESAARMEQSSAFTRRLLNPTEQMWQNAVSNQALLPRLTEEFCTTFRGACDAHRLRTDVPLVDLCEIVLGTYSGIVDQWRRDKTYPLLSRLRQAARLMLDMMTHGSQ